MTMTKKAATVGPDAIAAYAQDQTPAFAAVCDLLRAMIDGEMPGATSRLWHGSPVWFIGENPVVGYSANAKGVALLFWNGRAIDPGLEPVGKYSAAQARFGDAGRIDGKVVRSWLKHARSNVLDSRAYFKKLREAR